jgi:hypothetical protein
VPVPVYVALLHYPMTNRLGELVATAVTNMDLHDISRSCRTYDIRGYYIVTPVDEQHKVVGRILSHWRTEQSEKWHPDRFEALSRTKLVRDFESVKNEILQAHGELPEVVLTDARPKPNSVTYSDYRRELEDPKRLKPALIVFGTGWGISDIFYPEVHRILTPVYGPKDESGKEGYNHLSVRSAVAIILDRLLGH